MAIKASATITLSFMVDVTATYRYYKLQSSTTTAPAKPTTRPPNGWTDIEPTYSEGSTNTLYTVDCTVFSNNTFLYSSVSKSTSYEAAKAAYNKAVSAESTANTAKDTVDNLEIGGKNLLLSSNPDTIISTAYWVSDFTLTELPKNGETYTITIKGSVDDNGCLAVFFDRWNYCFGTSLSPDGGEVQSLTFEFPNDIELDPTSDSSWLVGVYNLPDNHSGMSASLEWIKLEKGNKATDWTPAPEDMDESIADVESKADSAIGKADNAAGTADSAIAEVNAVSADLGAYKETVESRFTSQVAYIDGKTDVVTSWIRQGVSGTTPYMELGLDTNQLKGRLTNERLSFYEGTNELAYFGNNETHIKNADIDNAAVDKLKIGKYTWIDNGDGHLSLVYTG